MKVSSLKGTLLRLLRLLLSLTLVRCQSAFEVNSNQCWSFSSDGSSNTLANFFTDSDLVFHIKLKRAENKVVMNHQSPKTDDCVGWGEEQVEILPFTGYVAVYVSRTENDDGFDVVITDTANSDSILFTFMDRLSFSYEDISEVVHATPSDECNHDCWSFAFDGNSNKIANFFTNTDLAFHIKLNTANELIMNHQSPKNDDCVGWGSEQIESITFSGPVDVQIRRNSNDDGFEVVITDSATLETVSFTFMDRINSFSFANVTEVTGAQPSCDLTESYPCPETKSFTDNFGGKSLDHSKWLVAHKRWGSTTSGGVVYDNVTVRKGKLYLDAHGSQYNGSILGVDNQGNRRTDGKRTGAAIATKDYYGTGKWEVHMKLAPELGVCSAIWTFFYDSTDYYGPDNTPIVNHEIDIELPGRPGPEHVDIDFEHALFNTWVGEIEDLYTTGYTDIPFQADGKWHTYRFDWHTKDPDSTNNNPPTRRVDFYIDNKMEGRLTTHVPTFSGRLWLGAWFPDGWAGDPNFNKSRMIVDWVKFTPYDEVGNQCPPESHPNRGWLCKDDVKWKYQNIKKKNCNWVRLNQSRCSLEDNNGVIASEACPVACGNTECIMPECANAWKKKQKGKIKRCKHVKGKKCGWISTDGSIFAYEACSTCGKCVD